MKKQIYFYRTVNQKCPVEVFLNSLPSKVRQKITWTLKLLVDLDRVPASYFSKMSGTDHFWECRVKLGSNIYRIFAFMDGNQIVLTHGIIKKTQKTPKREIQKAKKYREDYLRRLKKR